MDGGLVSESPSDIMGGGGEESPAPLIAYTDKFNEVFPYYLAIGMTYDQFWSQDCQLVKFYSKAFEIKQDLMNQAAWVQGMYIYEALCDVAPAMRAMGAKKPRAYSQEPYDLFQKKGKGQDSQKKKEEKSDSKAKAFMEMWALHVNKKFEEKRGE